MNTPRLTKNQMETLKAYAADTDPCFYLGSMGWLAAKGLAEPADEAAFALYVLTLGEKLTEAHAKLAQAVEAREYDDAVGYARQARDLKADAQIAAEEDARGMLHMLTPLGRAVAAMGGVRCGVCGKTVRSTAYVGYEDQALCAEHREGYSAQ